MATAAQPEVTAASGAMAAAAADGGAAAQSPRMPLRRMGGSSLEVPVVCMGTMTFGEQNTEEEAFAMLDYCMSRGVNFFDTAELYPVPPRAETTGTSERIVGRWMKARGNRDKVIVTSKVMAELPGMERGYIVANRSDPPLEDAPQPRLCAEEIAAACDASLRRLQTDYIDLYLIHWPARYAPCFGARRYRPERERDCAPFDEQVLAVRRLLSEGKIREWGVSNETAFGVCSLCEAARRLGVRPPASIQNDVSLTHRVFEGDLAECCAPRNYDIGLCAYGCLAGGTLTGKYRGGARPERSRHTVYPGFQPRYLSARTAAAAERYAALAEARGITPTQLALSWAASRWYMASVIVGATTLPQLEECIDACLLALDAATERAVDEAFLEVQNPNLTD